MQTLDPFLLSLMRAAKTVEARVDEAFAGLGLSWARYGVLDQLAAADRPVALGELASGAQCVRSNMTQLVDRLEADGLVRRIDDPDDRRSVLAELTELGRERRDAGAAELRRVQTELSSSVPAPERESLARALLALGDGPPACGEPDD